MTEHAVGPSVAGNGSGTDWNNMMVLPTTLTRGDTYWLADGTYSSTVTVSISGSSGVVLIKKAVDSVK